MGTTRKRNRHTAIGGHSASRGVRPKRVASPISTGARGVTFENHVQAHMLLLMCLDLPWDSGEGGSISSLQFQARILGYQTDDLVLGLKGSGGESGKLLMQMKRTLSPSRSNAAFMDAVRAAWYDFRSPAFCRKRDAIVIAYGVASAEAMAPISEICNLARTTSTYQGLKKKIIEPGFSNERIRNVFSLLDGLTSDLDENGVTPEDLHAFFVHLLFHTFDLDDNSTQGVAHQIQLLETAGLIREKAHAAWGNLTQVCFKFNGRAGDISLATVDNHIPQWLAKAFSEHRRAKEMAAARSGPWASSERAQTALASQPPGPDFMGYHGKAPYDLGWSEAKLDDHGSAASRHITRSLDRVSEKMKGFLYRDALAQLSDLGEDLGNFDTLQRARWYLLRGMCRWLDSGDTDEAAKDLMKAADLADDDEKFHAARIRAHLLRGEITEACDAAQRALERFPQSLDIWVHNCNSRMLAGEVFSGEHIPAEFRHRALAWQIVALSQKNAGDIDSAIQSSRTALEKEDASIFTKALFLRQAVMAVTERCPHVGLRVISPQQAALLQEAATLFADRPATVWSVQSSWHQAETMTYLSYAYLLTRQYLAAMEVIGEARARDVYDPWLYRVELDCLCTLGRSQEALERLRPCLSSLPEDALVQYAWEAVKARALVEFEAARAEGKRRAPGEGADRLNSTLTEAHWSWMHDEGQFAELREALQSAGLTPQSTSLAGLTLAAIAHKKPGGNLELAKQYAERVEELVLELTEPHEQCFGATLLYSLKHFGSAAKIYARVLPPASFSELHCDLLDCYLQTGQRIRLRDLLASMPEEWLQSLRARYYAYQFSRRVGDWQLTEKIAAKEFSARPSMVHSWLLRYWAAFHNNQQGLDALVSEAPELLEGSIEHKVGLAMLELNHGYQGKCLRRLYRVMRENMENRVVAELFVWAVTQLRAPVRELEEIPVSAGPGVCVTLSDASGNTHHVCIEPEDILGLPEYRGFFLPNSAEARRYSGLRIGDSVQTISIGMLNTFHVTALAPVWRRLLEVARDELCTPTSPSKFLGFMQLPLTTEGTPDITPIVTHLKERQNFTTELLEKYETSAMTLSMLARGLGRDMIDTLRGWPDTGPMLEVISDRHGHLCEEAGELLASGTVWVADMTMLCELASLGHLACLQQQPVLVSAHTRDTVMRKLVQAAQLPHSAVLSAQAGFQEITPQEHERNRDFLAGMLRAIDDYCAVVPAYGPTEIPASLRQFGNAFGIEEYSVLLLCLEHKASLMTLDARFRYFARTEFGIMSVWPQELLAHECSLGHIRPAEYSLAVLKMAFTRRSFVQLDDYDMIVMVLQGQSWLSYGVNFLRSYLCGPTVDFNQAAQSVINFIIKLMVYRVCEWKAALEIAGYLIEALMRHKCCPKDWLSHHGTTLVILFSPEASLLEIRRMVNQCLTNVRQRLKKPAQPVTVNARVLFCSDPPRIVAGVQEDNECLPALTEAV